MSSSGLETPNQFFGGAAFGALLISGGSLGA